MKKNYNEIFEGKLVTKVLEITSVLTVVFYIVYSIIKRFTDNAQLYWIPIVLFFSNFLVILEIIYLIKTKKVTSSKKEFINISIQALINLGFTILIITR
jgi:hypothetical protein